MSLKPRDTISTKDSRSAVLSIEQRLKNYQELYREVKHLYEINKEIFKINLSTTSNEPFNKVVSVLVKENKMLYDMIIRHFVKTNGDSLYDHMANSIVSNVTERRCGSDCQQMNRKLFSRIDKLEKELQSLSRKESREGDADHDKGTLSRESLRFYKEKKLLEQKLVCTEMRLSKIVNLKNELLRQNFVGLLGDQFRAG